MTVHAIRSKDTGQIYSLDEFLDLHNSEVVEQDNPLTSSFELAQESLESFIRDNKITEVVPERKNKMKLYAIRNKETGEIVPIEDNYPWSAMLWNDPHWAKADMELFHNSDEMEVVTLRIEPTEPCWRCKDMWRIDPTWELCPNCGRSLKREEEQLEKTMRTSEDHLAEQLQDKEFKAAYDEWEPDFMIADALLRFRIDNNLTQKELAGLIGMNRSRLSELESASGNPMLKTLKKIATALGAKLEIRFTPTEGDRHE